MMIYAKKLTDHDIGWQISITQPVVRSFIQNSTNDHRMHFVGKRSGRSGIVLLKTATDPRFGGAIRDITDAERGRPANVGDIMVLYKSKPKSNNYVLELIIPEDNSYSFWESMFNENDDHVLLYDDQGTGPEGIDLSDLQYLKNSEFADRAIRIMIEYDLFSDEVLRMMEDSEWSSHFIVRILPLLRRLLPDSTEESIQDQRLDGAGYNRYYDVVYQISGHEYIVNNNWYSENKRQFVEFIAGLLNQRGYNTIIDKTISGAENILFYGVPGSGKSHAVSDLFELNTFNHERIVFHPEYTFSDFVGQILPVSEGDKIKYAFVPGPFTNILRKAVENKNKKFYLVIEELNRGNAPAIFGDLFQLLDRNEVGESEYEVTNYDIAYEVYHDKYQKIRLPSNLWIVATMNTSDQNVFTLDTAFQRRWNMQLIKNDIQSAEHANDIIEGSRITWAAFAETVNDKILSANDTFGSFGDKRLGAYFAKITELTKDRFPGKVLKYLWDDAFKMNHDSIFKSSIKSFDVLIEEYSRISEDSLAEVLNEATYNSMLDRVRNAPDSDQNNIDGLADETDI